VSQTGVVTRLVLRELWISFRLLFLLAAYVGAGALVALIPAPLPTVLQRLAVGVAAAMIAGASIAAWSLSRERALGRAAWLATRSVPRWTILVGWFVALALITLLGLIAVGALGWLAASTPVVRLDPLAFGATFAAIACGALGLLALGLLIGTFLRPLAAGLAAAVLSVAIVGAAWLALPRIAIPIEALALLPELARPISVAIQGAGAGLAVAAVLLLVARVAMDRVDL
jgi:ABC-type transport system involved in multi-copper enzyme maturation permease subunit